MGIDILDSAHGEAGYGGIFNGEEPLPNILLHNISEIDCLLMFLDFISMKILYKTPVPI